MRSRADFSPPVRGDRARVVRVELGSTPTCPRSTRLTLVEAKELLRQLAAAVFLAEAAEQRGNAEGDGA